jgi:hypothetical protein
MVLDVARQGVGVRLLLDNFFDDEDARSNRATVEYVRSITAAKDLDLEARLGNSTGGGIHAKLVLMRVDGETWAGVASMAESPATSSAAK